MNNLFKTIISFVFVLLFVFTSIDYNSFIPLSPTDEKKTLWNFHVNSIKNVKKLCKTFKKRWKTLFFYIL